MGRAAGAFLVDRRGNVAIIFALVSMTLFGAVGGAIDFARVYKARTDVQTALDAGTLAAGRVIQVGGEAGAALDAARAYLAPLRSTDNLSGDVTFEVVDNQTGVRGSSDLRMATPLLAVMGFPSMPIYVSSRVAFGPGASGGTSVELAMMLDVTGSMRGRKIEDLKLAAEDMINIVVGDDPRASTARVALVPFSSSVKLDTQAFREATGIDNRGPGSNRGCVVERTGTHAYTDAGPIAGRLRALEDADPGRPCEDGREMFPLSSKKSDLMRMVRSLREAGSTAGHLGTAWAWYALSPNWASVFGSDNRPQDYALLTQMTSAGLPKLRKIAVLMTDGEYNTQYSAVSSTDQARELCREMKRTGIEVFTVGFELGGNASAMETLRGCASDESKFYNTTNGVELRAAFRDIALQASTLRLVK